jgi:hypothetical protein
MIAVLLALSIAAAPGEPTPQASREGRALAFIASAECRDSLERAEGGDVTYLERRMDREHLTEAERGQWRALCLVYFQGRKDEREELQVQAEAEKRRRP